MATRTSEIPLYDAEDEGLARFDVIRQLQDDPVVLGTAAERWGLL